MPLIRLRFSNFASIYGLQEKLPKLPPTNSGTDANGPDMNNKKREQVTLLQFTAVRRAAPMLWEPNQVATYASSYTWLLK